MHHLSQSATMLARWREWGADIPYSAQWRAHQTPAERYRFNTPNPVSHPSHPRPAPCPLTPHICKNLELSGLDQPDRASAALPRLGLFVLETMSECIGGGLSSPTQPAAPCLSGQQGSGLDSTRNWGNCTPLCWVAVLWEHKRGTAMLSTMPLWEAKFYKHRPETRGEGWWK